MERYLQVRLCDGISGSCPCTSKSMIPLEEEWKGTIIIYNKIVNQEMSAIRTGMNQWLVDYKRTSWAKRSRGRRLWISLCKRFYFPCVTQTVHKVPARAYRKHAHSRHVHSPQNIWETELIPRCEANHFIEPSTHEMVRCRCELPHNNRGFS